MHLESLPGCLDGIFGYLDILLATFILFGCLCCQPDSLNCLYGCLDVCLGVLTIFICLLCSGCLNFDPLVMVCRQLIWLIDSLSYSVGVETVYLVAYIAVGVSARSVLLILKRLIIEQE